MDKRLPAPRVVKSIDMLREPLPPSLGSIFAVRDAYAAGVAASRLRAHDLSRPFRGVRSQALPVPESPEQVLLTRVEQYRHRMTAHEFFSHAAAAALWGLPLPMGIVSERPLDVSVFAPRRAPAGVGVAGHTVRPVLAHVMAHPEHGVAVTTPASTVAMLAVLLRHPYDLVAVADAAVRVPMHRNDPAALATIEQLEAALAAGRRVGRDRLRLALPCVSTRSRSRAETWTRLTLVDADLPEPRANYDVVEDGVWLGQVDLAYPELKIAIEYEGEHHLTDPAQWAEDIARMDRLVEAGWRVIRVTKADVFRDSSRLVLRVRTALARARR